MSTDGIFFNAMWDVRITDTSLRDGSHHKRHQFTKEEVQAIVAALDAAGVPVIEVTHGDGLGGSSFNYGFSKTPEQELIKLAAETAKDAKIAFLMLPGVGIKEDIKEAQNNGGSICRIATHCTEADVSIQHFGLARELGLETVGFLMMSHTLPPEKLAKQARIMADAGCQCVYVVDSAGALVLDGVSDRVAALVAELGEDAQVGFHGHENLGLGVANSVEAVRAAGRPCAIAAIWSATTFMLSETATKTPCSLARMSWRYEVLGVSVGCSMFHRWAFCASARSRL